MEDVYETPTESEAEDEQETEAIEESSDGKWKKMRTVVGCFRFAMNSPTGVVAITNRSCGMRCH